MTPKAVTIRQYEGESTIDEVIAHNVNLHIEQMDVHQYWIGIDHGEEHYGFSMIASTGSIDFNWNELGSVNMEVLK